jgi:hypothetical protein
MIVGEAHQQRNSIRNPIIQAFHSWMCKRILGRMRETKCETWVPLGPHRQGSRSSPTSGSGLLEDPPTCKWAQPTYLVAHTTS